MREKRNSGAGWLLFLILTALILMSAWLYTGWVSSQRVLPAGVTMAGLPVGGMTREQALDTIAQAFASTVTLHYADETILLAPEMVDLTLDGEATATNLDEVLLAQSGLRGFIDYAIGTVLRRETQAQDVQPVFAYSRARLDSFLTRLAQQYDQEPLPAVLLPEAGTFRPAQPGMHLDIEASRPPVLEALLSAAEREVTLVVQTETPLVTPIDILGGALEGQLADFPGVAGVFVKDLTTGQELCLNCDVAFSGLSVPKIGIAAQTYRLLDAPPDPQTSDLLSAVLVNEDAAAADALLGNISAMDPSTGTAQVTEFMHSLGMSNTFIAAPYAVPEGAPEPQITTAANTRTDVSTTPDPYRQTTPLDAGLLLEAVYQCGRGGGALRILYPDTLTPDECRELLAGLGQNQAPAPLTANMPGDTRLANNQGWGENTFAEAAIIYSPGGDFVLSVFLYNPAWLTWDESTTTFSAIGQLTYRFFNPQAD